MGLTAPQLRRIARHDLAASLVVFLVAVPLSLGIAVASEAPVMSGLIAAAVGGLVAGMLGGIPLQVSGPAAGLTVIVAGLVDQFGWRVTCAMTVAAGVIQIMMGASRVARSVLAISPTVVHGMLAGIGATIALAQLHVLLGGASGGTALHNLVELPRQLTETQDVAAFLGLGVIALLGVWSRLPSVVRLIPGPLVAVVGLTLLAAVAAPEVARVELPGSLPDALTLPRAPDSDWAAVLVGTVTLAVVASVESLVSAVAVDKMRRGLRPNFDRELIGQGAANAVSGLLGGLPIAGVVVRSSTNVLAGATSRASTVFHGAWVVLFALALVGLLERIPMAVLAGLLIAVGAQLMKPDRLRAAASHGELPVYLVTWVGVVALGLLEGVLAGIGVSLVLMLRKVVKAHFRAERTHPVVAGPCWPDDPEHWTVVAEGTLSFLAVPRLSRVLAQIPAGSVVVLELVVDFVDHAVADHLQSWKHQHEASGGIVVVDELALVPRSTR